MPATKNPRIIDTALQAADYNPEQALLLILNLIWNGHLNASPHGLKLQTPR